MSRWGILAAMFASFAIGCGDSGTGPSGETDTGTVTDTGGSPDVKPPTSTYPPIMITVNAHGHNFNFPEQALEAPNFSQMKANSYQKHRDEVIWLDEETRKVGAKMSYQLNGEYSRDARLAGDDQHIRDLEAAGHSIGTHFHMYYLTDQKEFWKGYGNKDLTFELVKQTWTDHIGEVEQVLGHTLLRCDPAAGSHEDIDKLYPEFNIQIEPGGEVFSYTTWNIKPWNPFRRKTGTYTTEDLNGARVSVASLGQVGKDTADGLHAVYPTADQLKRHFLMLLAEWREHQRRGDPPKIWTWGIMTHPSSNNQYRADMLEMLNFLAKYTKAKTPDGTPIAVFATDTEVADTYKQWEKENPGASSFSFDWEAHLQWMTKGTGSPQPYPYTLEGVTLGLKDCDFDSQLSQWESQGVTVYKFINVEITRGEPNKNGQSEMTVGAPRLPVYLLWNDSGQPATIDFSSEKSGQLYVKDGTTGTVNMAGAGALVVTETPIVVSETGDYF